MIVETEETIAIDQLVHSISVGPGPWSSSIPWKILAGEGHSAGPSCGHTMAVLGWLRQGRHHTASAGTPEIQLNETPTSGNIATQGLLILYMMSKVVNLNGHCDCSQSNNFRTLFCLDYLYSRFLPPEHYTPSPCLYLTNRKFPCKNSQYHDGYCSSGKLGQAAIQGNRIRQGWQRSIHWEGCPQTEVDRSLSNAQGKNKTIG